MDHHYGNPVHMAALSMQSHQQPNCQQHYSHQGGQYQHFYNDYADVCYQSPGYHDGGFSGEQYGYHPTASVPYGTGIESYLDPKYAANPAAFASRLPYLPFHAAAVAAYGMYDYSFEPAFIRKRNERERQRVKCVNEGYARLREHLPEEYAEKRLSKVETLRGAIVYIKQLQTLLGFDPEKRAKAKKNEKAKSDEQEKKKSEDEKKATDNSSDNDTQNQNGDKEYSHTQNKNNNQLQSCVYNEQNLADDGIKMESPIQTKDGENEQSYDNEDALLSSCVNARYRSCMKNQQNETFNKASSGANSADTLQFQAPRNNLLSPFDCQVEENKRKNLSDQNPCYHKNNFISSPNTDFNANIVSWTQSASKQNPLYNEFPNKSYSRKISCAKTNTVDPFDDMFQNSRHHPYKRFASMSDSPPEHHWVNGIRVKSETHTPPPYVRYDFPDHQDNVLYPPYRYNYSGSFHHTTFNMNQSGRGGQSDGFKSDTSPESSAGQSP